MSAADDLKREFTTALDGLFKEIGDPLELIIGQAVLADLAGNETLYDQQRYDVLFKGFHRLFGWSRVQFHQKVHELKGFGRYDLLRNVQSVLPNEAKGVLLKIIDQVILLNCLEESFASYVRERAAIKLNTKIM